MQPLCYLHKERMGKGHCSLSVDLRGQVTWVRLLQIQYGIVPMQLNGGCGLIAKPLECTPGSQTQE